MLQVTCCALYVRYPCYVPCAVTGFTGYVAGYVLQIMQCKSHIAHYILYDTCYRLHITNQYAIHVFVLYTTYYTLNAVYHALHATLYIAYYMSNITWYMFYITYCTLLCSIHCITYMLHILDYMLYAIVYYMLYTTYCEILYSGHILLYAKYQYYMPYTISPITHCVFHILHAMYYV